MLSRPKKIRQVYSELQTAFGEEFSAGVLLKLASRFVEFIDKANDVDSEFLRTTDSRSSTPRLDIAFADGGWMLLHRERDLMRPCFDDEVFVPISRLRKKYPEMERSLFDGSRGNLAREWIVAKEWINWDEK